jgi:hypothetical protein
MCNPCYSEGRCRRSEAGPDKSARPYLKSKLKRKGLGHGSRDNEFKPQDHQKTKIKIIPKKEA